MTLPLTTRAPAKINLSLHVLGRRADGYHDLESLVAFAGAGDLLGLDPGPTLSLSVAGPTAPAAGDIAENLVMKAARALAERVPGLRLGAFTLLKRLPVAAGIGGGSSDAAGALRLLARANDLPPDDPRLFEAARATGADVPVCLDPRARMMRGIGEQLGPPLGLTPLATVLVNPGVALETRLVFGRMAMVPGVRLVEREHPGLAPAAAPTTLMALLAATRNDMEPAARELAPDVARCIASLTGAAGLRLARMSGSGTTCFGVFDDCRAAVRAAQAIRAAEPGWWVRSTILR